MRLVITAGNAQEGAGAANELQHIVASLAAGNDSLEIVTAPSHQIREHLQPGATNIVLVLPDAVDPEELQRQLECDSAAERPLILVAENADPSTRWRALDWNRDAEPDAAGMQLEAWLAALSELSPEALLWLDPRGRVSSLDAAAEEKLGFAPTLMPGQRFARYAAPEDRRALLEWLAVPHHPSPSVEISLRVGDSHRPVRLIRVPSTGQPEEERAFLLANGAVPSAEPAARPPVVDGETQLGDEHWLTEGLRLAARSARARRGGCALLLFAVDGLEEIRTQIGEEGVSMALQAFLARIRHTLRTGDRLARLGHALFGLSLDSRHPQSALDSQMLRIRAAAETPVTAAEMPHQVRVRFGMATCPADGPNGRALLRVARRRLLSGSAPEATPPLPNANTRQAAQNAGGSLLQRELEHALAHREFQLFVQPQVDLRTFAVAGVEVLLRWRHPQRGLLSPAQFLPVAESTSQICQIGDWVLDAVCTAYPQWSKWLDSSASFAINVSPVELHHPQFLSSVLSALGRHRVPGSAIELEITETAVIASRDQVAETIDCLRRNGLRVALDDFGVGYSSLSHLRDISFTKIKIDKTFVHRLEGSHRCRTIVQNMIDLGRGLRLSVNAEGVETPDQLRFLYESGCDQVQGYLFAKPMPLKKLESWLKGYLGKKQAVLTGEPQQAPAQSPKVLEFHRSPAAG